MKRDREIRETHEKNFGVLVSLWQKKLESGGRGIPARPLLSIYSIPFIHHSSTGQWRVSAQSWVLQSLLQVQVSQVPQVSHVWQEIVEPPLAYHNCPLFKCIMVFLCKKSFFLTSLVFMVIILLFFMLNVV